MADEKNGLNLVQKIAQVQAGLPPEIKKEGHNKFQNYDYVTEAQVKKLIRQPLAQAGVIINPKYETTNEWTEPGKSGGVNHFASVLGKFELTDGFTSLTGTMPGTGIDSGEKAVYKAETGAQKNYLMQLFMISTGDDPERDMAQQRQQQSNNSRSNGYQNNNYRSNNRYSGNNYNYQNNQKSNSNYQNNNNRSNNNYRPRNNNQNNVNINDQVMNDEMFTQVKNKIRNTADVWQMNTDDVSLTLKNKFKYRELNKVTNGVAKQMLAFLNDAIRGAKVPKNNG